MPTTIGHYNYKFSLDANDFANGARLTKSELALVNQALRESQTAQDKAQASFNAVAKAYATGKTSLDQTIQAYEHLARTTPEAIAAQKAEAAALAEGKRIMDAHKPAVQSYREEITKLNSLLRAGAIDQRAHTAEVARARGSMVSRAIGMAGIPVVGDLVEKGVAGAAIHPAFAAVTVGAAAAKQAMSTFMAEAEKIDQVGKGAQRLGIRTEEYITLGKAAKRADIDMAELVGGFSKMNKAIGEAVDGGKTQQEAFEKLGLSYKDLAQLSPYEAFKKISDALRNTTDPYARAAIGADIFGRESAKLNEVLRMGSTEFDKIYETARRSGQLFSGEQADAVERAAKSYERLGSSWNTLKQNLTIMAAPEIERFFTSINTVISTDAGKGIGDRAAEWARAATSFGLLRLAVHPFLPDQQKPGSEAPEDARGGALQAARERQMAAADDAYYKAAQDATKSLQEKYDALKAVTSGMAASTEEAKIMEEAEKAHNITLGQQIIDLMELKKQQDAATKAKEEAARKEEALNQSARDLIANLQEEQRLRELTGGHLENATKQLEVYRLQVKGLSGELLDQALAEAKAADAAKTRDDMNKQIDQALQHGQTPQEKYEAEIRKLQEWQKAGADAAKIQRLMDDAAKAYFHTMQSGSAQTNDAMEATEQNLARSQRQHLEMLDSADQQRAVQMAMQAKFNGAVGPDGFTPEDQVGWMPAGTYTATDGPNWTSIGEDQVGWMPAGTYTATDGPNWTSIGEDMAAIGADGSPAQIGISIAQLTDKTEEQNAILERIAAAAETTAQRAPVHLQEIGSL